MSLSMLSEQSRSGEYVVAGPPALLHGSAFGTATPIQPVDHQVFYNSLEHVSLMQPQAADEGYTAGLAQWVCIGVFHTRNVHLIPLYTVGYPQYWCLLTKHHTTWHKW